MLLFRLAFPIAGLALLFGALTASTPPGYEGAPATPLALVVSLAVALGLLGGITMPRWRRCSLWLALAVAGQATSLQLIDAGKQIHYQHYRGWEGLLSETHPVIQVIVVVQLVAVLVGIAPRIGMIAAFLRDRVGLWRLLVLAVGLTATAATVSRDVGFFVGEVALAGILQVINLGNVFLVAASLPDSLADRLGVFLGVSGEARPQPRFLNRFSVMAAVWVFMVAAALNWFSYQRFPHVADEVVYLYPARYFAAGLLTMPSPPVSEAFEMDLMVDDGGRWYSPVPPGWPVLLAVGVTMGVPWLVNPLLAALGVLPLSFLIAYLYSPGAARLAALLTATSPWYLFLAMSYMNHIATLTMALLGAAALVVAHNRKSVGWAMTAGLAVGFVALIRPMDGLIAAGGLGLILLVRCGGSLRWKLLLPFMAGTATLGIAQLAYNQQLIGNPLHFPLNAYFDAKYGEGVNDLGFGADRGLDWEIDPYPGHGFRDVVVNAQLNFSTMNTELHGWATGSLLAIGIFVLAGRPNTTDWLLVGLVGAVIAVYSLYWFSGGPDFGPRYWFLAFFALMALSTRGILAVSDLAGSPRVIAAAVCLTLMCVLGFLPWRGIDKYFHFRGMRPDLCRAADTFEGGLVLVRGEQFPDYMAAATCNPIDLANDTDRPVFAWDRDPSIREKLAAAFPDRPIWIVNGPSLTGGGYVIVEGPQ